MDIGIGINVENPLPDVLRRQSEFEQFRWLCEIDPFKWSRMHNLPAKLFFFLFPVVFCKKQINKLKKKQLNSPTT